MRWPKLSPTPDGQWLFYTDSESQEVGIVDISDPAQPLEAGILTVAWKPGIVPKVC